MNKAWKYNFYKFDNIGEKPKSKVNVKLKFLWLLLQSKSRDYAIAYVSSVSK